MRASAYVPGIFVLAISACCFPACSGDPAVLDYQSPAIASPGQLPAVNPAMELSLPSPAALKDISALVSGLFNYGYQFDTSLLHQRVTGLASLGARFTPDYDHAAGEELAIALYTLDTTGYDPGSTLTLAWAAPGDYAAAWVGLADYPGNRWDWRKAPAAGAIVFDPARHLSGGKITLAIVVTGTTERTLDYLWLGSTRPPLIVDVTPEGGRSGIEYSFECLMHTGSGAATTWAWDFGSAATPATSAEASPTVTLQSPGVYFINVTASNSAGTMDYEFPLAVSEAWTNWEISAITGGFEDLIASSLALEHDGEELPHVAFATESEIYYFNYNGHDWNYYLFDQEPAADIELTNSGLAVDAQGRAWLAYGKRAGYVKCYSYDHGITEWSTIATPGAGPPTRRFHGPRLALDSSGLPHASYEMTIWDDDWDSDAVMYSAFDGSAWSTPLEVAESGGLMDIGSIEPMVPLALDGSNNPFIAFCGSVFFEIGLAHRDGTWNIDIFDSANITSEISLDIDDNGNPHVAYIVIGIPSSILYASFDGVDWTIEQLIGTSNVAPAISLKLDSHGNPHIAYYNGLTKDLHMAFYEGEWYNLHVDSAGDVGRACSLALDSTDRAHITYFNWNTEYLMYALEPLP